MTQLLLAGFCVAVLHVQAPTCFGSDDAAPLHCSLYIECIGGGGILEWDTASKKVGLQDDALRKMVFYNRGCSAVRQQLAPCTVACAEMLPFTSFSFYVQLVKEWNQTFGAVYSTHDEDSQYVLVSDGVNYSHAPALVVLRLLTFMW